MTLCKLYTFNIVNYCFSLSFSYRTALADLSVIIRNKQQDCFDSGVLRRHIVGVFDHYHLT